jgi:hypothetical protein
MFAYMSEHKAGRESAAAEGAINLTPEMIGGGGTGSLRARDELAFLGPTGMEIVAAEVLAAGLAARGRLPLPPPIYAAITSIIEDHLGVYRLTAESVTDEIVHLLAPYVCHSRNEPSASSPRQG